MRRFNFTLTLWIIRSAIDNLTTQYLGQLGNCAMEFSTIIALNTFWRSFALINGLERVCNLGAFFRAEGAKPCVKTEHVYNRQNIPVLSTVIKLGVLRHIN